MEINQKDKITILLHLLNERYNASHKIRETSLRLTIWILGLAVAFVWILVNGTTLTAMQKLVLTIIVIILGGSIIWFLHSLETGSIKNRKVMIDLEEALGCYEKDLYIESRTLFPNDYKTNSKRAWSSHFKSIYILIIPITILIIILVWLTPLNGANCSQAGKINPQSQIQIKKPK